MVFGAFYFSAAVVGWRIEVEAERFLLGWINSLGVWRCHSAR